MRRFLFIALLLVAVPSLAPAQDLRLPNKPGSLKFADHRRQRPARKRADRHRQADDELAQRAFRSSSC